jgi:hypothetical protein
MSKKKKTPWPCANQCVCQTNVPTSSPKCHVSFSKEEKDLTSTFSSEMSPQCHMPSRTCHFNLQRVNWHVGFFFASHTTYIVHTQIVCVNWRALIVQFLCVEDRKPAKTCPKYTSVPTNQHVWRKYKFYCYFALSGHYYIIFRVLCHTSSSTNL